MFCLLRRVLRTVLTCAPRVIVVVAALAALQWNNWFLHCYCVPLSDASEEVSVVSPYFDLHLPSCVVWVAMIRYCGIEEQDANKEMWEVLRNIQYASSQDGMTDR